MNKTLTVVFFSRLEGKSFKAPRLQGYVPELAHYRIGTRFYGLHPPVSPDTSLKGLIENKGVKAPLYLMKIGKTLGGRFGFSTIGRYWGCNLLSYMALRDGYLKKSDGLFTQPYFFPLVKEAKKLGLPVILESDNDYPSFVWDVMQKRHSSLGLPKWERDPWNYWPYVKRAMKAIDLADKIIIFSPHNKKTFIEAGVPRSKLVLAAPPPSTACKEADQQSAEPVFLWAGNHGIRKGIDLVYSAWKQYKQKNGRGILHIVGAISPTQVSFRKQLAKLPGVVDHGTIPLIDFFRKQRCVLLSPSYSEGLPRTVTEALACGSIVVGSESGTGGLVINDKNGYLISDLSADSLLTGLRKAEQNWEFISTMGRISAKTVYKKTENFYTVSCEAMAELIV